MCVALAHVCFGPIADIAVSLDQIVGALLPAPDARVVERVVATAGGNPLFIEELVAALEDDPNADEPPASVRAAIAARIDALTPLARTRTIS